MNDKVNSSRLFGLVPNWLEYNLNIENSNGWMSIGLRYSSANIVWLLNERRTAAAIALKLLICDMV
jgi:hypothetical protein